MSTVGFYTDAGEQTNVSASVAAAEAAATASATSASGAASSEANALSYSNNASTSANNAGTSETNASASEAIAAMSADDSANSAIASAASAVDASVSEGNALTSENNAAASAAAALVSENNAAATLAGALTKTNNLSDVSDVTTSRMNLDVYSKEETDTGRKNYLINGNMEINQRGDKVGLTASSYTLDRWQAIVQNGTVDVGQSTDPTLVNLAGTATSLRFSSTVGGVGQTIAQSIEGVHKLSGKEVTLSFLLKSNIQIDAIELHTFADGIGFDTVSAGTVIPSTGGTDWIQHSFTFTLPDTSGYTLGTNAQTQLRFEINKTSTNVGQVFLSNVQLEEGSVATPFEYRSVGEELALCQRYFWQGIIKNTQSWRQIPATLGNTVAGDVSFPVTLRVPPSVQVVQGETLTGCVSPTATADVHSLSLAVTVSGAGSYRATGGIYAVDAEL